MSQEIPTTCRQYGRIVNVSPVRILAAHALGVGFDKLPEHDNGQWFVYDFDGIEWTCHCGPYSDREQAVVWINSIRETK